MNILIATNHEYIKYTTVMLYSLFIHNDVETDLYMPYTRLSDEDLESIERFFSLFSGKNFYPFKIPEEFDRNVISHNGISIETYYRILAIDYLPVELDRILYLDVDMVIQGSVQELYDTDFDGKPFVVCEDILGILNDFHEANKYRMGIPGEYTYFNAGVMLFNLKVLREEEASKTIIERVIKHQDKYEYNDQDVLNEIYYDRLKIAPWDKYNCPPAVYMLDKDALKDKRLSFASYKQIRDFSKDLTAFSERYIDISEQLKAKAIIIHYMGAAKPWTADEKSKTYNSFNEAYFKYELFARNRMEKAAKKFVDSRAEIVKTLLADNYTFYYLRNRLIKASEGDISAIVAGSSYGVQGVLDKEVRDIVNLSGPSQDLAASLALCRMVIESLISEGKSLPRYCILLIGYYALYDDLKKAPADISKSYYITYEPLLRKNNFSEDKKTGTREETDTVAEDKYDYRIEIKKKYEFLTPGMIEECDKIIDSFFSTKDYFNENYYREDNDRDYIGPWTSIEIHEREEIAKKRTAKHNHLSIHSEVKEDTEKLLDEFIGYLSMNNIIPVFIIPPFTKEYNSLISKRYKEEIFEFLDARTFEISLIDMNEFDAFSKEDFFDSDHLNDEGAKKLTKLIQGVIEN